MLTVVPLSSPRRWSASSNTRPAERGVDRDVNCTNLRSPRKAELDGWPLQCYMACVKNDLNDMTYMGDDAFAYLDLSLENGILKYQNVREDRGVRWISSD